MNDFKKLFTCPIPSVSTPFLPDGEIDYPALNKMCEQYLAWKFPVLMLTAGDSNFACLTDREIAAVTTAVLDRVKGRAFVIVADRGYATPAALEFASKVKRLGAGCYMALPPDWAASTTPETLAEHYSAIAEILPVMVVTNLFSARSALDFGLEVCKRIAENPQIVAIKDDICGEFGRQLCSLYGGSKAVIAGGMKKNHWELAPCGACGYLSTFARFLPQVAWRYWEAYQAGDMACARKVIDEIDNPYFELIEKFRGGFNSGIYATLELAGLARRCRRKPYADLTETEMESLKTFWGTIR